jgi:CubicO group peptidase (beta-lactamase class C family)
MRALERIATALIVAQCLAIFLLMPPRPTVPDPRRPPGRRKTGRLRRPRRRAWIQPPLVDHVGMVKQDSLLVIRHGKIVAEAYYAPYAPNIRHDLRSVTKSMAIEIEDGLLNRIDHPIVDLFADKHIANVDDAKRAMTVQNMLDMTPGNRGSSAAAL